MEEPPKSKNRENKVERDKVMSLESELHATSWGSCKPYKGFGILSNKQWRATVDFKQRREINAEG